jgi:hypothetical protein
MGAEFSNEAFRVGRRGACRHCANKCLSDALSVVAPWV